MDFKIPRVSGWRRRAEFAAALGSRYHELNTFRGRNSQNAAKKQRHREHADGHHAAWPESASPLGRDQVEELGGRARRYVQVDPESAGAIPAEGGRAARTAG